MVTWTVLLWLAASAASVAVAAVIFLARPHGATNRRLALALLLDGLAWTMLAARVAATRSDVATAALFTQILFLGASIAAYLGFLRTLDTPLTRPFRTRGADTLLAAAAIGFAVAVLLRPGWFYAPALVPVRTPWNWDIPHIGPGALALLSVHTLVLVLALAAAVHAWHRQAPASTARSRAGWYAAAFGVRDASLLTDWVAAFAHLPTGTNPSQTSWGSVEIVLLPASFLVFCALISYGILRHQLFDIELKLKLAVEKSTIAALFAVAFLTASELIERLLGFEGLWFGVGAAVLIGLLFRRVERVGEAVADRLMPGVEDSEEYRTARKRELYRAALESALVDGRVTDRERDVLATLADQLGLSSKEALDLERMVAKAGGDF